MSAPQFGTVQCPTCGRTFAAGTKFCPEDGSKIVPPATKLSAPAGPPTMVSGSVKPLPPMPEPSVPQPSVPQPSLPSQVHLPPPAAVGKQLGLGQAVGVILLAVALVAAGAGIAFLNRPRVADLLPTASGQPIISQPPPEASRPEPTIDVSEPKKAAEPVQNTWKSPFFEIKLPPGWTYAKRQADATYTGISFASPDGKAILRVDRTDPRSGEILPFIEERRTRFAKGPATFQEWFFGATTRKGVAGFQWNFDRQDSKRGVLRKEIFYFSIGTRGGAVEMNAPNKQFERYRADFEAMFESLDLSRF